LAEPTGLHPFYKFFQRPAGPLALVFFVLLSFSKESKEIFCLLAGEARPLIYFFSFYF